MRTNPIKAALTYFLLTAFALFTVAPFGWMLLVSLHPSRAPIPNLTEIVPQSPAWSNYALVLFQPELPVYRFFFNSILVATLSVGGQLLVCSLAAYGFARLKFPGREAIFNLFLLSMMFAGVVTQIPVFLMVRNFGWLDNYAALIVPGLSSAFNIFLLRQFFSQIPTELDEAAKIDGASELTVYAKVILPLSKAALATAAAFSFIAAWTDFFWPLLATSSVRMRTLEVGLAVFKNSYGGTNWPLQMTAAVIVMLPLVVVFLFVQKYFVRGITMGSIK